MHDGACLRHWRRVSQAVGFNLFPAVEAIEIG